MTDMEQLWDLERRFWLEGPDFDETRLAQAARMVFPDPVGVLGRTGILAGLEGAPRWGSVDFAETGMAQAGTTAVLTYRATGRREGAPPYRALCSSTYVDDSGWRLLAHQQTPLSD